MRTDLKDYVSEPRNGTRSIARIFLGIIIATTLTACGGGGSSPAPTPNAVGVPTITGTPTEDQTLTADTTGISDADGLGAFTYQWLRDSAAIGGATASTHPLGDADVGTQISVQVSFTDGQGTAEGPLTSTQTAAVANVNDVAVGLPTITGTPTEDQTLTADTSGISDADGLGGFSYQWLRDGVAIGSATASTYIVEDNDVGTQISVRVSFTDGQGTAEGPLASTQTAAVANVNDAPVGVPTITGTPTEDQTLTADTSGISDADGLGAFSYQWLRDSVAIGGATANTYILGDVDVGTQISVQVSFTDGQGTAEGPLTSTQTAAVANVNDAPVANDDDASVNRGFSATIDLAGNDTDVDDGLDLTSIVITSGPANGTIDSVNADGTVDYTHDGSATLSDSFTYTIDDAGGVPSNEATVNLTVLEGFNEALYATPTVSSSTSPARELQANDGLTLDSTNGWVATAGPATITLTFDSPKSIYRVTLSDLVDLTNQVTSATIDFSNGDQIVVSDPLPNDGTAQGFVFAPKLVDSITVTLDTASGVFGLSEFSAFSALDPGQTEVIRELFNDATDAAIAARWPVTDECASGTSTWSGSEGAVAVNNEYVQSGDCRGFSAEGVELGSYPVLAGFLEKDMDLRLRFKSTDTSGSGATWVNGAIGVLFAYRSTDYYRLDISQAEGHTKLWKKVAGNFAELTTSPQSYPRDEWVNLRIVRQNGVIVIYMNNVKVMAVEDNEFVLNNDDYQIALMCARNESCSFENLIVLTPPSDPIVGVNVDDDGILAGHLSGEYFVDTSGILDLVAAVTDSTGIDGVEFEVDGDAGTAVTDSTAPYTATFSTLTPGNHTVRAYLRDSSGRLSDVDAVEVLPAVGVSGIHLVGLGDSITGGLFDDIVGDDTSIDGRNTSGGYQPVLNNLLTTDNGGVPATVLNEGNAGELAAEGATRIAAVLARTPAAQGYLAIYGANDSGGPTLSGTTLTCTDLINFTGCDVGYLGSFKHSMQRIINAVTGAGKAIYLGKSLPHLSDVTRNTQIQEYNTVIDELISENSTVFIGYTAPDFHAYFESNPSEMADDLHPDGAGYQSMADLWCTSLNGQAGMACSP